MVQPLLITELVFALVLRRVWIHRDVARAAWVSVSVVCVSLAVFLAVGEPTGGHPSPAANQWLSAVLVFGGAITVLTVLGLRGAPARRTAALAATGLMAALEASFLRTATQTLSVAGVGGMLTDHYRPACRWLFRLPSTWHREHISDDAEWRQCARDQSGDR